MDKQLKQRLVGAIVLVSLGVIFIPALLDGSGYKSRHGRSIEIPDEPKFAPLTQLEVEKIKTPIEYRKEQAKQRDNVKLKPVESKKVEPKSQPKKIIKKVTKTASDKPVQAWVLQVATFGEEANALVLQDKLRADKHPAYVSESKVDGKKQFKVRIGPIVDKKRVEKLKEAIKATHKLDGYVMQHPSK